MAAGLTNRGSKLLLELALANVWRDHNGTSQTLTKWQAGLIMAASAAPSADTNVASEITEPSTGGYARIDVPRSAVGWTSTTEDDTNDKGVSLLQDLSFSASGGSIGPVRYVFLVGVDATDTAGSANAQIVAVWQLASDTTIASGTTTIFESGKLEFRNTSWS